MIKRILPVVLIGALSFFSASAKAQELTPEQQAQMEQLQQMGQQIQQNIESAGLDINQLREQFQNDPEAGLNMLVQQGIVSPDMLNQMFGTIRSAALTSIRQQLASTDEEWAILEPKLLRVVTAMIEVEQNQVNRLAGRVFNNRGGTSEMDQARARLKAAIDDPNTSTEEFSKSLQAWRMAHQRAKAELTAAREDLLRIVTLRQEGILLLTGVL